MQRAFVYSTSVRLKPSGRKVSQYGRRVDIATWVQNERRDSWKCLRLLNTVSRDQTTPLPMKVMHQRLQIRHNQQQIKGRRKISIKSLQDVEEAVIAMHRRTAALEPLPPFWSQNHPVFSATEVESRQEIFENNRELIQLIATAVEQNILNPSGKHGRDLSVFLGLALKTYTNCAASRAPALSDDTLNIPNSSSVFNQCMVVLRLLENWNLDLHSQHYENTILAAVRENRWKDAADLYWRQIDPDRNPLDISISSPIGLYAIARHSQEEGTPVVEQVMDAVLQMCMVSPLDQEKYVLSAGTALGLAGESMSFLEYLENSYNTSRLGQPLYCAVMHACILCNQHDEALQVFDNKFYGENNTVAAEFHYGGEHTSALARDLAMRAMGGSTQSGLSSRAMELCKQVNEDGSCISIEALEGVMMACERDRNWKDAISVLFKVLDNADAKWIVNGESLTIPEVVEGSEPPSSRDEEKMTTVANTWLVQSGRILTSAMRTCNSDRQFGAALLCSRLFESYLPRSIIIGQQQRMEAVLGNEQAISNGYGSFEKSFIPLITGMGDVDDILTSAMISLAGLGCNRQALALYELAQKCLISSIQEQKDFTASDSPADIISSRGGILPNARDCYSHILADMGVESYQDTTNVEDVLWESPHRHICRLTGTLQALRHKHNETIASLSPHQEQIIECALAKAIRSCNTSGQPEVGICLSRIVKKEISRLKQNKKKKMFFERDDTNEDDLLVSTDSLLAVTIEALQASNRNDIAIQLFQSNINLNERKSIESFMLSCNAMFALLTKERKTEDAMNLAHKLIHDATVSDSSKNADTYIIAARLYADNAQWNKVGDLYHLARANGCLTEDLGVLAMKSIIKSEMQGRLRALRGVVDDLGTISGITATKWMELRYWKMKRLFGFSHTRLLMWWNDPRTSHLDELELALEVFEKRKLSGLKPKSDIIRLIVSNALHFDEETAESIKDHRRELSRVPFTRNDWINALSTAVEEDRTLRNNAQFIDEVALAFRHLNCNLHCLEYVNDALSRGIRVRQTALQEAHLAACEEGVQDIAEHIKLLLVC